MTRLLLVAVAAAAACAPGAVRSGDLPRIDPGDAGFDPDSLEAVAQFVTTKAEEGAFPGGVLVVGRGSGVALLRPVGVYGPDDPRPVESTTLYDMASLTKVVGLTTAAYLLLAEGRIDLDAPVQRYVPEFTGPGKEDVLVRHLLTHTSGLPAWVPLHLETPDRTGAFQRIDAEPLEHEPGTHYTYSDLGAILMMRVVEAATGEPFDDFLARRLFGPLRMRDTRFNPPAAWRDRIAPTEDDPWRGRVIRGEVHDENAYHLGGVSGHAGLFSTGPDLARFALWMLDAYHDRLPPGAPVSLPAATLREFTRRQPGPEGSTRALGWDTPTPGGGASSGRLLSASSFGHTGFTGTSIWIDPEQDLFIILLTNRVHPSRENRAVLTIRGEVADLVVRSLRQ